MYTIILVASADTAFNCADTVSVDVEIIGNSSLDIPIVFSPNGDGVNDIYKVNASFITSFKATIYNRWGAEMYSWDNVNSGWDGRTYSGTEVPDGTYFILIEAIGIDGVEYNGNDSKKSITLIRER
jgi:gliding motility-associated-like protein